jgi:hypothetical protein
MTKEKDLFEVYETLPKGVKRILSSYNEDDWDYSLAEEMLERLEKVGYTFDYGLCGEPQSLRKIVPVKFDSLEFNQNQSLISAYSEGGIDYVIKGISAEDIALFLYEEYNNEVSFTQVELSLFANMKIKTNPDILNDKGGKW